MKIHKIIPTEDYYAEKTENFLDGNVLISKQRIFITYPGYGDMLEVSIDGQYCYYPDQERIALNCGYNDYKEFFDHYVEICEEKGAFSGFILHFTNSKYLNNG